MRRCARPGSATPDAPRAPAGPSRIPDDDDDPTADDGDGDRPSGRRPTTRRERRRRRRAAPDRSTRPSRAATAAARGPGGPRRRRRAARRPAPVGWIVPGDRRHRGRRGRPPVQRRARPVDRRALVPERRLRLRLLDPARRRRLGLGVGACLVAAHRPARQPLAGRPARAAGDRRTGGGGSLRVAGRSPQRGRRRRPISARGGGSVRRPSRRPARPAAPSSLRRRRHARPDPARRLGPGALASCHRAAIGGRVVRRVGDGPALDQHRVPFSPIRDRRRPIRSSIGHRLLPVRAAVPAPRPGRCSTASSSPR